MEYTPKYIRKTLKKTISEISSNPQSFSKNPEKDFSRTRKLPFEKVVNSVLSMSCKDLKCELMDIFEFDENLPTVSAFVQQRNKISSNAFEKFALTFSSTSANIFGFSFRYFLTFSLPCPILSPS